MKPVKIAIIAALVAVGLASGSQYYSRQQRAQEVARLRAENDRMRRQASQLQDALISQARAVAKSRNPATATSNRADLRAAGSEYRNEGQATPGNALHTFAWACDQADEDLMEKLIVFDPAARDKIVNYFASLSPEGRPKTTSLEAWAATMYISDGMKIPYPVAEILRLAKFDPINATRVILRLPGANGDGYEFQHTIDGWKLAITVDVADGYIQESSYLAAQR